MIFAAKNAKFARVLGWGEGWALGPLRPLRGSRAPSCDFALQSSSLRSSGDLTASPQVHLALRQPDACRRGRMTRDHEHRAVATIASRL